MGFVDRYIPFRAVCVGRSKMKFLYSFSFFFQFEAQLVNR